MYTRIKQLRQELGLTQTEFGRKMGLSRDVINNIEHNRAEIKDHIIKLICDEYRVSPAWLRSGDSPMFQSANVFSLDRLVQERGGSELELEILKAYFDLDPTIRHKVLDHFVSALAHKHDPAQDLTVEDLEAEYKKASSSQSAPEASALSTTADTDAGHNAG